MCHMSSHPARARRTASCSAMPASVPCANTATIGRPGTSRKAYRAELNPVGSGVADDAAGAIHFSDHEFETISRLCPGTARRRAAENSLLLHYRQRRGGNHFSCQQPVQETHSICRRPDQQAMEHPSRVVACRVPPKRLLHIRCRHCETRVRDMQWQENELPQRSVEVRPCRALDQLSQEQIPNVGIGPLLAGRGQ